MAQKPGRNISIIVTGDTTTKLTKQQLDTRCSIRFLDDIFQFGYALRYSHHDYTVPQQYVGLLEEYLAWCHRKMVLLVLSVSSGQRCGNFSVFWMDAE